MTGGADWVKSPPVVLEIDSKKVKKNIEGEIREVCGERMMMINKFLGN